MMKRLVRIILLVVMAVYLAVALTAVINGATATKMDDALKMSATAESTQSETKAETAYIVKTVSGKIAVEDVSTSKIVRTTDTRVAILPEEDRERLNEGIAVKSKAELRSVLEDLCS